MVSQASRQRRPAPVRRGVRGAKRAGDALAGLFPENAGPVLPSPLRGRPRLAWAAGIAALAAGAAVLLLRVPGQPWHSLYAEDQYVFLVGALSDPWHLLASYAGYLELAQRLIAQIAAAVPLGEASDVFALAGAAVASGCALFVFHASAGHISSPRWRALLAACVVLAPVAPLEIADNTVNAPWYLIMAVFWAVLWRPRTRAGMAVAALIAFFAAASDPLAVLFAPVLFARVAALRRVREHAVTAGWAAGCLLQFPVALTAAAAAHVSRLGRPVPLGESLAFYGHDVLLPAFGWHAALRLQDLAGRDGATLAAGGALAAVFAVIIVTACGRVRLFVLTALLTGLLFTLVAATFSGFVPASAVTALLEPGSRYTTLPIFLFGCAAIVAADARTRQARAGLPRERRLRTAAAAAALVAVLAGGWVADFRYPTSRSQTRHWAPIAGRWLQHCEQPGTRSVTTYGAGKNNRVTIPCANLRR